jgi:hypothetical protein
LILIRSLIFEIAWPLAPVNNRRLLKKSRKLFNKENRMAMID